MASLERLMPFPSYASVIRFHGRPILPPLRIDSVEIQRFRKQAEAVAAQIQLRKTLRLEYAQEIENLSKMNVSNESTVASLEEDVNECEADFPSADGQFSCSVHSSSSLEEIQEEVELALNRIAISADTFNISDSDSPENQNLIGNLLLDTAQTFQENLQRRESLNLVIFSETEADPVEMCNDTPVVDQPEYIVQAPSPAFSNNSENARTSEMEYPSFDTVILNNGYSNSVDSDSIAQSTDLEKYMDPSAEDSQMSEPSTIVDDIHDLEYALQNANMMPEDVPLLSQLLATRKDAVATVDEIPDEAMDDGSRLSDNRPASNGEHSDISNKKESFRISLTPMADGEMEMCSARGDHHRSSSYTIDVPSPVLLKSHADCQCMHSPTSAPIPPHCASIRVCNLEQEFGTRTSEEMTSETVNSSENEQDSKSSDDDKNALQILLSACSDMVSSLPTNISEIAASSPKQKLLDDLYETFKDMHQRKVQMLLQQHQDQWKQLEEEFQEQEIELRSQIDAIVVLDNSDLVQDLEQPSVFELTENIQTEALEDVILSAEKETPLIGNILEPPKSFKNGTEDGSTVHSEPPESESTLAPSVTTVSSRMSSSYATDVSDLSARREILQRKSSKDGEHLVAVLKALSDPDLHKKFTKVSAMVKGYLTRRLIRTPRLQNILNSIQEAAYQISSLGIERERMSDTDSKLYRIWSKQFKAGCKEMRHIFFEMTTKERMKIIRDSRKLSSNSQCSSESSSATATSHPFVKTKIFKKCQLSSATQKRLERKNSKSHESLPTRSRQNIRVKKSVPSNMQSRRRSQSAQCNVLTSSKQNGSPMGAISTRKPFH